MINRGIRRGSLLASEAGSPSGGLDSTLGIITYFGTCVMFFLVVVDQT